MTSSIHLVIFDFWLFAQAKKKNFFLKVNIIGISLRMVTACQWLVINSTFDAIDDKVIDLIILYFGFTSLAQSFQNMSNDPFTV